MVIIVTGGAGFIGSNLVAALDAAGERDIVVCDRLESDGKWRNIAGSLPRDIILPEALHDYIATHGHEIRAVFHLGAISSTTATDGDAVVHANFSFSVMLWQACARLGVPFIYASSAAVYGDGTTGFVDSNDLAEHRKYQPLNLYGWSKWLFDGWVLTTLARGEPAPPSWSGLRFFNVYGPREAHKASMRSLVAKIVASHQPGQAVKLFKSYRPDYADGGQLRDFIYVADVVAVMLWLHHADVSGGLLNVGTGVARSFYDLAAATIRACGEAPRVEYVEMPAEIRDAYQYYTCADMGRLRRLGYNAALTGLEAGVTDYVTNYLLPG